MTKFNVGDWVIGNKLVSEYYGIAKEGYIAKVINVDFIPGNIIIKNDDETYDVNPDCFDLYRSEKDMRKDKIVIISDRNDPTKVVAHDFTTDLRAEVKCSKDDKFDFNTGAKLAFERLMEMKKKPKAFTGYVVCISSNSYTYTVGKVYKVTESYITDDTVLPFYRSYNGGFIAATAEEISEELKRYGSSKKELKFIEYKGERAMP